MLNRLRRHTWIIFVQYSKDGFQAAFVPIQWISNTCWAGMSSFLATKNDRKFNDEMTTYRKLSIYGKLISMHKFKAAYKRCCTFFFAFLYWTVLIHTVCLLVVSSDTTKKKKKNPNTKQRINESSWKSTLYLRWDLCQEAPASIYNEHREWESLVGLAPIFHVVNAMANANVWLIPLPHTIVTWLKFL